MEKRKKGETRVAVDVLFNKLNLFVDICFDFVSVGWKTIF